MQKSFVLISNLSRPLQSTLKARYCDTFFSRFAGLMFRQSLDVDSGIILVNKKEDRVNSSIHMLFMNFDIAVIWLSENYCVVDLILARKWDLVHSPKIDAKYVLEIHHTHLSDFCKGDVLQLDYA